MANKPEDYVDSSISALEFAAEALMDASLLIMAGKQKTNKSKIKKSKTK